MASDLRFYPGPVLAAETTARKAPSRTPWTDRFGYQSFWRWIAQIAGKDEIPSKFRSDFHAAIEEGGSAFLDCADKSYQILHGEASEEESQHDDGTYLVCEIVDGFVSLHATELQVPSSEEHRTRIKVFTKEESEEAYRKRWGK